MCDKAAYRPVASRKMRILHTVQSYLPERNGMQKFVQELSERLEQQGHRVTVATSGEGSDTIGGVNIERFQCAGNLATGLTGEICRYRNYVLEQDYDIVVNFAAQQWATDALLPYLDRIQKPKVSVPTGFSGLYLPEYAEYFERMKMWAKHYDATVFHSYGYRDIKWAQENHIPGITYIPYGASEQEFEAPYDPYIRDNYGIPRDRLVVLLVGSHTGQKGHREAIRIFKRAQIGKATLVIVGEPTTTRCTWECAFQDLISSSSKKILVVNPDRKDIVALYHTADVFMFPSNIEAGPLVLYEAMASRTPWLATDVGCAKELEGGWILPTTIDAKGYSHANIGASALFLEKIYKDPQTRRNMGLEGHAAWKQHYTWDKVSVQYEMMYERLIKSKQ